MGMRFPKDLVDELNKEMPKFGSVINYHAEHIGRSSVEEVARIVDLFISNQQELIAASSAIFGKKDAKVKDAKKKMAEFQVLKSKVLNLLPS